LIRAPRVRAGWRASFTLPHVASVLTSSRGLPDLLHNSCHGIDNGARLIDLNEVSRVRNHDLGAAPRRSGERALACHPDGKSPRLLRWRQLTVRVMPFVAR
jgi:hypothetical protein